MIVIANNRAARHFVWEKPPKDPEVKVVPSQALEGNKEHGFASWRFRMNATCLHLRKRLGFNTGEPQPVTLD